MDRLLKTIRAGVGWVGLARLFTSYHTYKDIWEARSGNSYYANARMATVLIRLLLWLSRAYFRRYRVEREVLAPFSVGRAYAFYTSLFTS